MRIVGLMGAKKYSQRLPNKAKILFNGRPMFEWNVIKGVALFGDMYVTSDDDQILKRSEELGAIPIKREDPRLLECPNIEYYKYCFDFMEEPDAIVAIQVNSPTVSSDKIKLTKRLLEHGVQEVMTAHPVSEGEYHDRSSKIYGSIWGLTKEKLKNYGDPHKPEPEVLIIDDSVDIHYQEDLEKAFKQC